jgi:hypothetical protein
MTRRLLALLAAMAAGGVAGPALAREAGEPQARLELRSRTYFLPAERSLGLSEPESEWPIYQFLELAGHDLAHPGLSFHTSVWGFGDLGSGEDPVTGDALSGDVDVLYAEYADPEGRFQLRLGRQLVLGAPGVGNFAQLDGGWGRFALGNFDLQAYGGQTVERRFRNWGEGDWSAGGRVGYHAWSRVNAGVSYLHARNGGGIAREHVGADLAVVPLDGVDVVGDVAYDLLDMGLARARGMVRYAPLRRLVLGVGAEQASPGRLLDKTSIFSVFSLGDYAQGDVLVQWSPIDRLTLAGRYARVAFADDDGEGLGEGANRFGASASVYLHRNLWLTVEGDRVEAPEQEGEDNAYSSVRVAGRYTPADRWTAAVDLLGYFYDRAPLDVPESASRSLVARAFAERRFGAGTHVALGGEVAETVLAESDVRGFLRITQDLDLISGVQP